MKKFDKYWVDYNDILAMVVIFYPQVKLSLLKHSFSKANPNGFQERLNVVKDKLSMLYKEYAKISSISSHIQNQQSQISLAFSSIPSIYSSNEDRRPLTLSL